MIKHFLSFLIEIRKHHNFVESFSKYRYCPSFHFYKVQTILVNDCVSWRQTDFCCSPNGDREPINDKSCNEAVPDNVSGFCECREGVRTMQKTCKKGKFLTCNDACNIGSSRNINLI